jgi:hypothetical protein
VFKALPFTAKDVIVCPPSNFVISMSLYDFEIDDVEMKRFGCRDNILELSCVEFALFLHDYLYYRLAGFDKVFTSLSIIDLIYKLESLVYSMTDSIFKE